MAEPGAEPAVSAELMSESAEFSKSELNNLAELAMTEAEELVASAGLGELSALEELLAEPAEAAQKAWKWLV